MSATFTGTGIGGMAKSRDLSLGGQYFAADGAAFSFGQAPGGAAWFNRGECRDRVAGSGNDILLNENFVAKAATLALGKAVCGAGGCNGGLGDDHAG